MKIALTTDDAVFTEHATTKEAKRAVNQRTGREYGFGWSREPGLGWAKGERYGRDLTALVFDEADWSKVTENFGLSPDMFNDD